MKRYSVISILDGIEPDPGGALVYHDDAMTEIARLRELLDSTLAQLRRTQKQRDHEKEKCVAMTESIAIHRDECIRAMGVAVEKTECFNTEYEKNTNRLKYQEKWGRDRLMEIERWKEAVKAYIDRHIEHYRSLMAGDVLPEDGLQEATALSNAELAMKDGNLEVLERVLKIKEKS